MDRSLWDELASDVVVEEQSIAAMLPSGFYVADENKTFFVDKFKSDTNKDIANTNKSDWDTIEEFCDSVNHPIKNIKTK